MTISEQLSLSVLTAPVASLDRRTLSQAWYSALYRGATPHRALELPRQHVRGRSGAFAGTVGSVQNLTAPAPQARVAKGGACPARAGAEGPSAERRSARTPLARRIERLLLRPGEPVRRAALAVDGSGARVHLVLHTQGNQTMLLALCPRRSLERVAQALEQARYALASRGVALQTLVRADAS